MSTMDDCSREEPIFGFSVLVARIAAAILLIAVTVVLSAGP